MVWPSEQSREIHGRLGIRIHLLYPGMCRSSCRLSIKTRRLASSIPMIQWVSSSGRSNVLSFLFERGYRFAFCILPSLSLWVNLIVDRLFEARITNAHYAMAATVVSLTLLGLVGLLCTTPVSQGCSRRTKARTELL